MTDREDGIPHGMVKIIDGLFDSFPDGMRELFEAALAPNYEGTENYEVEGPTAAAAQFVAGRIDWAGRNFIFEWVQTATGVGVDAGDPSPSVVLMRPPNFNLDLGWAGIDESSFMPGVIDALTRRARWVWLLMSSRFYKQIERGELALWGRPDSPLNDLVQIPADSWQYFKIVDVDWRRGHARCEDTGTHLFSLRVIIPEGRMPDMGPMDISEATTSLLEIAAERAQTGMPMTSLEMELWANDRRLPRSFVRDFRSQIDSTLKLSRGRPPGR